MICDVMAESSSPQSGSRRSANDIIRLREILEQSTEPILILNRQGRLVYANDAWQRVTGCTANVLEGTSFTARRSRSSDETASWHGVLAPPDDVRRGNVSQVIRLIPADLFPSADALPQWWELTYLPLSGKKDIAGQMVRIRPKSAAGVFEDPPLPERIVNLRHAYMQRFTLDSLAYQDAKMQRVRSQIHVALSTRSPVMIVGKRGVGKEWLARVIHTQGAHPEGFFISIDCRRLPSGAVAAIVFGRQGLIRRIRPCTLHFRGPDALPREIQGRIADDASLWSEEDGQLHVTASMTVDPDEAVGTGRLLPEFFALVSPLTINLPPLRERREDIHFYAQRMLAEAGVGGNSVNEIDSDALSVLNAHEWPGNLTELFQVLTSACQRETTDTLTDSSLPYYLQGENTKPEREFRLDELLEKVERRLIELALREASNKKQAAELLSIWRPRLLRRIAALGLDQK